METQPGTRTALVDPFGRELEQWLRDAPTTTHPYVADLVVPPVTGPIRRPDTTGSAESEPAPAEVSAPAFRRDRGRHASACAPSFPEPPARMSLNFGDLAIEVSASSGRTTIERIAFLEQELDRRDADLARLAAWEARVDDSADPEVAAARVFAAEAFADILADALEERDELDRRAHLRTVTTGSASGATPSVADATVHGAGTAVERDDDAAVPGIAADAHKPTPLVQPATGPNAIHRAAFEEAVRTHSGHTAEIPTVFPLDPISEPADEATHAASTADADAPVARPSWWSRFVAGLLRIVRR